MFKAERLPINGYWGEPVPNEFLRQEHAPDRIAVLLPGLGYTCAMPLFYYSESMLLDAGVDVLRVEYAYARQTGFKELPWEERLQWLFADTAASLRTALEQRPYRRITLVGKSLGTLAMGYLLANHPELDVQAVWLTPILGDADLRARMARHRGPSLIAMGTADPEHEPIVLNDLHQATGAELVVVPGADHSLDIPGDPVASVAAVGRVVAAMRSLLAAG